MKRFLYLAQVEGELPRHLRSLESDNSDVRFLSWKTRVPDPRAVFYPHSSWTQGRNRLFREIAGTNYAYYIFVDDDVEMHVRQGRRRDGWRAFEAFLDDYEPAVGVARYMWQLQGGGLDVTQPVQGIRFFDALVNAFHRDAVRTLLPYCDLLDHFSECYSQSILCSQAAVLYPGHVLQCNTVEVINLHSRRPEREYLYCRADDLFLGGLTDPRDYAAFRRLTKSALMRHPSPGDIRRKGRQSYVVSEDELWRRFDRAHRLWSRQQELAALPKEAEFFSDRTDTERARNWQAEKASRQGPPVSPSWRQRVRAAIVPRLHWVLRRSEALIAVNRARKAVRDRVRRMRAGGLSGRHRRAAATVKQDIAGRWALWRSQPDMVFEVSEPLTALRWVGAAIADVATDRPIMIDVGGLSDDAIRGLVDAAPHRPILSIGVTATPHPKYQHYWEFALAQVSDGPEDPAIPRYRLSTLIRHYGIEDEVIHYLGIADQASNLGAIRSLDGLVERCLVLRIVAPMIERHAIESLGFRLFAIAPGQSGQDPDLLFVNPVLLERLLPPA